MPVENLISSTLTAAQSTAVTTALGTVRTNMPFLRNLSPEQRQSLPKMGARSLAFVNMALMAAKANSGKLPPSFDLPGFEADIALYNALGPIATQLIQLQELFDDTQLALSSDLYSEALEAYTYLKAGNASAGLDELKATLSQRFMPRKKTAAADTTKPAAIPAAT